MEINLVKRHQRIKKIYIFCMYYNMVVITVEKYENAVVHTITVKNKKLLWVKMRMCKKDWV